LWLQIGLMWLYDLDMRNKWDGWY